MQLNKIIISFTLITCCIYRFIFTTYLEKRIIENINYDTQIMIEQKKLLHYHKFQQQSQDIQKLTKQNEERNSIALIQPQWNNHLVRNLITYANGAKILFKECSKPFESNLQKENEFLTRLIDKCFIDKDCCRLLGGEMYKSHPNGRIAIQLSQPSPIQIFIIYARYSLFNAQDKRISLQSCLPDKYTFLGSEDFNNKTLKPRILAQAYIPRQLNYQDKFQILKDIPMVKLFLPCNTTACSKNIKTLYIEFENNSQQEYLCHYGFGAYVNINHNIDDLNQFI